MSESWRKRIRRTLRFGDTQLHGTEAPVPRPSLGRYHRNEDWEACLTDTTIQRGKNNIAVEIEAPSGAALIFTFIDPLDQPSERIRTILEFLWTLDDEAFAFLAALENWPYGDDVVLWQVIEDEASIRLCFMQESVNDEQIIGFERKGDGWNLIGFDPRWRSFDG